jgi:hypothetical protein
MKKVIETVLEVQGFTDVKKPWDYHYDHIVAACLNRWVEDSPEDMVHPRRIKVRAIIETEEY